ncbi:Cof-type HAD-IIB family hydrolase [Lacticaseibacillus hulanensis]|uniref:Cof-type HAD-IIB family hydrolase n=1 Tax=Lacticaseibacillus hulanensis TaxID=2493111 RepID=UPI000FD8CB40|nr:Cof-type HAD-IIB family hydrolase [Lacticaseibacillus hulanensis]
MQQIKLIALDLDDTLLTSNGTISPKTVVALKTALAAGIKVVPCSGRPLAGVSPHMNVLGIEGDNQYAITFNGSVVSTASGRIIQQLTLSNAIYRRIDAFAAKRHVACDVLDANSNIYTSNRDIHPLTVKQAWENNAGIFVRTPDELPDEFSIVKAVIVGDKDDLDASETAARAEFGDAAYVVRNSDTFLEIMNPGAGKGNALKLLAADINIAPAEIAVFGDERNDISMFDFAGTAVAMGNGSDLAKAHATMVTTSNDEDGIAVALAKLGII